MVYLACTCQKKIKTKRYIPSSFFVHINIYFRWFFFIAKKLKYTREDRQHERFFRSFDEAVNRCSHVSDDFIVTVFDVNKLYFFLFAYFCSMWLVCISGKINSCLWINKQNTNSKIQCVLKIQFVASSMSALLYAYVAYISSISIVNKKQNWNASIINW